MTSEMYLYLMLFGLANCVFFGIVTFFVISTRRQQQRLNQVGKQIEALLRDMREAEHLLNARAGRGGAAPSSEEEAPQP